MDAAARKYGHDILENALECREKTLALTIGL
jgi:hypothetical protein